MKCLGLGSNVGNRITHLRRALSLLTKHPDITVVHVSPTYQSEAQLTDDAPHNWQQPFLNIAILIETDLSPYDCLAICQDIEQAMGRIHLGNWSPRTIDIDVLEWDNIQLRDVHLNLPHPQLHNRPFALWPLMDIAPFWTHPNEDIQATIMSNLESWGSRYKKQAPFQTHQIHQRIDGPVIVGILNVTPDSFSDAGKFVDPEAAFKHAQLLLEGGAEIIDIGAESTNHLTSTPITPEEEWARLKPVLDALTQQHISMAYQPTLCIDTRHHQTAEKALKMGVHALNDVTGLADENYRGLVAESKCQMFFMHQQGIPADKGITMDNSRSLVEQMLQWFEQRIAVCESSGIDLEQLVADVGIGFGKSATQDMFYLQHIELFHALPIPFMVGHSRKSFFSTISPNDAQQRFVETAVMSGLLSQKSVPFVRVHNPLETALAIRVSKTFTNPYRQTLTETSTSTATQQKTSV